MDEEGGGNDGLTEEAIARLLLLLKDEEGRLRSWNHLPPLLLLPLSN